MNEQLEFLQAIYSRPNELIYDQLSETILYNAFDDQRQTIGFAVTVDMNQIVRIESQVLTRDELKELRASVGGMADLYDLFTSLKNFYDELMMKRRREEEDMEEDSSAILMKIDHMRSPNVYMKHLRQWTDELAITGRVLMIPHGIFILIEGMNEKLKKFIVRLKTETVDIDSRGRPCKERLLTQLIELNPHPTKFDTFEKLEFPHRNDLISYLTNFQYENLPL